MQVKKEEFIKAMKDISLSKEMEDRIMEKCKSSSRGKDTKYKRPLRRTLIAAACIILLAGIVFAVVYPLWTPIMAEIFGADEVTQAKLSESKVAVPIGIFASENGLTVTAEEIIGDEFGVYVLLKMEAENPEWLGDYSSPMIDVSVEGGFLGGSGGWADEFGPESEALQEKREEGVKYFAWWIHSNEGESLNGKEITIEVTRIRNANPKEMTEAGFAIYWEGDIQLTWTLDYNTDTTTVYSMDYEIEYMDIAIKAEKVAVSPISVCVYYTGVPLSEHSGYYSINDGYEMLNFQLSPKGITMEDGTHYDISLSGSGVSSYVTDDDGNSYWRTLVDVLGGLIGDGIPVSLTYEIGGEIIQVPISEKAGN